MKERISAVISGLHFGQLKPCSRSPFHSDFEVALSHIPYTKGYALENFFKLKRNAVKEWKGGPHIKSKDPMPYGGGL